MERYKLLINCIYEKDGTLYLKEDDEYIPIEINLDCYSANQILSRGNVKEMPYEVNTNSEISHVSLPSSKLEFELETNVGLESDEVKAILDYFSKELESADEEAREELIPMEKEAIQERFSEFLDWPEVSIFCDTWTDDVKIDNFLEELHEENKWPTPDFHDDDEIREICRNYLKD